MGNSVPFKFFDECGNIKRDYLDANFSALSTGAVPFSKFNPAGNGVTPDTLKLQSWLDAIAGGAGVLNAGDTAGLYFQDAPLIVRANTSIFGLGIGGPRLTTSLDIEQITTDGIGAYNVLIRDLGIFNTKGVVSVVAVNQTGNLNSANNVVLITTSLAGIQKGQALTGAGIAVGTFVQKVDTATGQIYLCDFAGVNKNPTATTVGVVLTFFWREGQTKFHIHAYNAGHWLLDNIYTKSNYGDTDLSPNAAAGVWFDRNPAQAYFINIINNSWIDHGQVLVGTSDSYVKNTIIWSNPFDYCLKLAAPNIEVVGSSISAGFGHGGIWITKSATEAFGASNHNINGNNIDGGDIYYSGTGMFIDTALTGVLSGNRFNDIYGAAIAMDSCVGMSINGNTFFNNDRQGLGFADIQIYSGTFQSSTNLFNSNAFTRTAAGAVRSGYAIQEIAGAFYPQGHNYQGNTFSTNYTLPGLSIQTPVGSGQYPRILGNAGSAAETESLPNATTNQFAVNVTGMTGALPGLATFTRQGNLITLSLPGLLGTSNSTAMTLTGLPVSVRPTVGKATLCQVQNNGASVPAYASMDTAGTITFFTQAVGGLFVNTGGKGVYSFDFTYALVG